MVSNLSTEVFEPEDLPQGLDLLGRRVRRGRFNGQVIHVRQNEMEETFCDVRLLAQILRFVCVAVIFKKDSAFTSTYASTLSQKLHI